MLPLLLLLLLLLLLPAAAVILQLLLDAAMDIATFAAVDLALAFRRRYMTVSAFPLLTL